MFDGKPIIGLVGGIGSGKSFVADLFGEIGCLVIHSDKLVDDAYNDPQTLKQLRQLWGDTVFQPGGRVNRRAIAAKIFDDPTERKRLESLLHPIVNRRREEIMRAASGNPGIVAFVWDSPLLLETGLRGQCDVLVYVHAPEQLRKARVLGSRGWDSAELVRRENLQWPLDKKRGISDDVVDNTADPEFARGQVKDVLFRIRGKI